MKIQYRIVLNEGEDEFVTVEARSINSGFVIAAAIAADSIEGEFARIEFWQVKS